MNIKKHNVFGKYNVTYEQVADALGLSVKSLRTMCSKKYGNSIERYLTDRGINAENFQDVMASGVVPREVSNEKAVDMVMRAIVGDDYKPDEPDKSEERIEDTGIEETEETVMEAKDMEKISDEPKMEQISEQIISFGNKYSEKLILGTLNAAIIHLCDIADMIDGKGDGASEAEQTIMEDADSLALRMQKYRAERFMKHVDWEAVAQGMEH